MRQPSTARLDHACACHCFGICFGRWHNSCVISAFRFCGAAEAGCGLSDGRGEENDGVVVAVKKKEEVW